MRPDNDLSEKAFNRILHILSLLFFAFCCWLFLSGCKMTKAGAYKRIAKVKAEQPDILTTFCSIQYDPVILERFDTLIKEGKIVIDTVEVDCDSVMKVPVITKIVRIPCPPKVCDTFYITKTVTTENKAEIERLNTLLTKSEGESTRLKKGKKNWIWVSVSSIVLNLILAFVSWRFLLRK